GLSLCCIRPEPAQRLLRVGTAALKTGSECSCTTVHSASSSVFALHDSSSRDPKQILRFSLMSEPRDRKSTRLNSSHVKISYAVFCLKKKKKKEIILYRL